MTKKIYVEGAGCTRRQLDTARVRRYLEANGYTLVERPEDADRILVTTCAFKKKEEDQSVNQLRSLRKYDRQILVLGCLPDIAERRYGEFADLPNVPPRKLDEIDRHFEVTIPFAEVPASNVPAQTNGLVTKIRRRIESNGILGGNSLAEVAEAGVRHLRDLVRGAEKSWSLFVCRGCLGKCSYCAIRWSVGKVKSKPIAEVVEEFREGVRAGYATFNVLGDDPGCYGVDRGETLPDLLEALGAAAEEPDVRARLPNGPALHIKDIHPKFAVRYEAPLAGGSSLRHVRSMLCPVQSGSRRVLALMDREHAPAELGSMLKRVRTSNPEMILDTQIIVGFPTETEEELEDTLAFVRDTGFNSVVVFPYHDKEGTPAYDIGPKVPEPTIRTRMRNAFRFFGKEGIKAYYSCP